MKKLIVAIIVTLLVSGAMAEPIVPGFVVETYAELDFRPERITFDPHDCTMYAGNAPDAHKCRIYKIEPGGVLSNPYGDTAMWDPDAVVLLVQHWSNVNIPAGSVLVGGYDDDLGTGHITALEPNESTRTLFTGNGLVNTTEMVFDNDNRLLIADRGVLAMSDSSPSLLFAPSPGKSLVEDIAVDFDNRIYAAYNTGEIHVHDASGNLIDNAFVTGLCSNFHMDFGPGGVWGTYLYVLDFCQDALMRIESGGDVTIVGTGFDGNYRDMRFGPDNALYVSDVDQQRILRIYPEAPCGPEVVCISGGEFEMGDHYDVGHPWEKPLHTVYVDNFCLSKYEITNRQYCDYLNWAKAQGLIEVHTGVVYATGGSDPYSDTTDSTSNSRIVYDGSSFEVVSGRENHPVANESWFGAVAYCNWLSEQQGYESCYDLSTWECDLTKNGYRLPTEAEWEYAARGGLRYYKYPWGNDIDTSKANYSSSDSTAVGSYPANDYGLHDMAGNVTEWCNDWWDMDYYDVSPYDNPTGPASGLYHVHRGARWDRNEFYCRVALRDWTQPVTRWMLGFRPVRRPEPPCWQEQDKLLACDGQAGDHFGDPAAISGDYAFVGVPQDDDQGTKAGSVYVYKREGDNWIQQTELWASDAQAGDYFGYSVAVGGDYLIVGAIRDDHNGTDSGSVYVFERSDNPADPNWYQRVKLTASDGGPGDNFGHSISISGEYIIVGVRYDDDDGTNAGSAYIFKRGDVPGDPNWYQQCKISPSDAAAGNMFGNAASIDGDYAIVGAYTAPADGLAEAGAAYIFKRSDNTNDPNWYEQSKLTASDANASDLFGHCVSISGGRAVVGAYKDDSHTGSAYIFARSGTPGDPNWYEQVKLTASDGAVGDFFGHSVMISGDYVIAGAPKR